MAGDLLDGSSGGSSSPEEPGAAVPPGMAIVEATENPDGTLTVTVSPEEFEAIRIQLAIAATVMGAMGGPGSFPV
ncbi:MULTISPECIES: hypothetical protein [unclassified Streptomyces]|uniref:Uncharacterized protein n=1 Tax=Streptomyces millisiae TaxID=3075542 RepID=A0ABU2LLY7_9ACTN|nr:hypothetical protein [Streptomyces sp. DSM 44918]MDT0318515.1 hypothetical protein [Streptomyces sp. DSM 44918]